MNTIEINAPTMNTPEKAQKYASKVHQETNHTYDDYLPYEFHLRMVVAAARRFIHLVPDEMHENVIAGCWVHDAIEDCRQTFNDIKAVLGEEVAELAYALTNEKGRDRKERANDAYYAGIRNTPGAVFVKICDRIANSEYSKMTHSSMLGRYHKEMPHFKEQLYSENYKEMWVYLDSIYEG